MLRTLSVRNLLLIDKLDIKFGTGLCVLTGETGAGKSILLDALSLALGARSDIKMIRQGADSASVTISFEILQDHPAYSLLKEHGFDTSEDLIIRRTINTDGRTRSYVNESPTNVTYLKLLGNLLIEIEGQGASNTLLNASNHREYLDLFADNAKDVNNVFDHFHQWKKSSSQLEKRKEDIKQSQKDEEYIRHVSTELEMLNPLLGEEESLATERAELLNEEKLSKALSEAIKEITEEKTVAARLRNASHKLETLVPITKTQLQTVVSDLQQAAIDAYEAEVSLIEIANTLEPNSTRLEQVEERLFTLRAVARKHNTTVDALGEKLAIFKKKLEELDDDITLTSELTRKCDQAKSKYFKSAKRLGVSRRQAAKTLDERVNAELPPLKLSQSKFFTRIEELSDKDARKNGLQTVNFEISTNLNAPLGPLAKIASGGERARLLLALKVCLTKEKDFPSLVFDEVDAGIGGAIANAVGERLSRLAKNLQVLVVTHSPQVAARGQQHIRVFKEQSKNVTRTCIEVLDANSRQEEIARMLSGAKITNEARAAARALILSE